MAESFVVIWRHGPASRWQVQPFVHSEADADAVGARLLASYGGEAWCVPITIPEDEDPRDLEHDPWAS